MYWGLCYPLAQSGKQNAFKAGGKRRAGLVSKEEAWWGRKAGSEGRAGPRPKLRATGKDNQTS